MALLAVLSEAPGLDLESVKARCDRDTDCEHMIPAPSVSDEESNIGSCVLRMKLGCSDWTPAPSLVVIKGLRRLSPSIDKV